MKSKDFDRKTGCHMDCDIKNSKGKESPKDKRSQCHQKCSKKHESLPDSFKEWLLSHESAILASHF